MSRERILVVDDEPQIQRFLRPALEAAGYDVVEAQNGADALRAAATAAPALVILDIGLPDMDGKDVIRALREWSEIPIIVLTAKELTPAEHQRLNATVAQILQKGTYSGEDLLRHVCDLTLAYTQQWPHGMLEGSNA